MSISLSLFLSRYLFALTVVTSVESGGTDERCPALVLFNDGGGGVGEGGEVRQQGGGSTAERGKELFMGGEERNLVRSCDPRARKRLVYTSRGNQLQVSVVSSSNETYFLLFYQGSLQYSTVSA